MINNSNKRINKYAGYVAVFASCVICAFMLAVFLGYNFEAVENFIIIAKSPFEENSFFRAAVGICFPDIFLFMLLSLSLSNVLRVVCSSAMFFFRGLVVGSAFKIFFENSVHALAVTVLISYCSVTALALVYDAYLNTNNGKSTSVRFLCYLTATGAAAIIRIIPMLLL